MIIEYLASLVLWFRSLSLIPRPYDLLIASILFFVVIPIAVGFKLNIAMFKFKQYRCRHKRELRVTMSFSPPDSPLLTAICGECRGIVFKRPADPETVRMLRPGGSINLVLVAPSLYRLLLEQIVMMGVIEANKSQADLEEVLKELKVKLLLQSADRIEIAHFKINRRLRRLYVRYPSHIMPYLMDVKVVEVLRNRHANRIICSFQLVGRLAPYEYVLDSIVVGEDSSGMWMARTPPELWSSPLQEQLKWIANLDGRISELVES